MIFSLNLDDARAMGVFYGPGGEEIAFDLRLYLGHIDMRDRRVLILATGERHVVRETVGEIRKKLGDLAEWDDEE